MTAAAHDQILGDSLDRARELLHLVWGHTSFRPGQAEALAATLDERDAVVLLPTGSGKSLCYQLPALLRPGCAVVISPLISLMQDQVNALRERDVDAAALNSQQDADHNGWVLDAFENGELDLLYVSPERAVLSGFRRRIERAEIALLAIDEAHCISQWGHDFRPEYMRLAELRRVVDAPTVALTATATERVLGEIISHLGLHEPAVVRTRFVRSNLRFSVEPIASESQRLQRLIGRLGALPPGRAIVYCATRKKVESVAAALVKEGISAAGYHAGMRDSQRKKAHAAYDRGDTSVLVATNAFGMGIDHPDVRAIVHFQTPGSIEAYYQEAGRAGRDGEPADCVLYFGIQDLITQRRLGSRGSERDRREIRINEIEGYARGQECRQITLHRHFSSQPSPVGCDVCDVCRDPHAVRTSLEAFEEARKPKNKGAVVPLDAAQRELIIGAVTNLSRPVGKSFLAKALRGSRAKTMRRGGLSKLPQHGALRELDEGSIVAAIDELLDSGALARAGRKYPTVWLPGKAIRKKKAGAGTGTRRRRKTLSNDLDNYRRRQARRLKWKPYMVFQRKVIEQIERLRPDSLWALEQLDGIGPAKVQRFGRDLLDLIAKHRDT